MGVRGGSEQLMPDPLWEIGDIGFDTSRKLWFIQLTDKTNQTINTRHAHSIVIRGGLAAQYQWKDAEGRPFWHIRERFFARGVRSITETPEGHIEIVFKDTCIGEVPNPPDNFSYLLYAYHLIDKVPDAVAPMGFVEFFDEADHLVSRLNQKWIFVEGVRRQTIGEYPAIRIRVERNDVQKIIVTRSCVILQGSNSPDIY
jgi:hypothetical protein